MIDAIAGGFNYWVVVGLIMIGLYMVAGSANLVKKVIGLSVFQSGVFILFITMGKVSGGSAPIASGTVTVYSNPLPHVLILTAIVVGVATTAVALALVVRIHESYGSLEEGDVTGADREQDR